MEHAAAGFLSRSHKAVMHFYRRAAAAPHVIKALAAIDMTAGVIHPVYFYTLLVILLLCY